MYLNDKRKKYFNALLANSERLGIPKRVIQIYIDQINNKFEVK